MRKTIGIGRRARRRVRRHVREIEGVLWANEMLRDGITMSLAEQWSDELPAAARRVALARRCAMNTESIDDFAARVRERTGMDLNALPLGSPDDLIGGHIFCRRGGVYVVAIGYPDELDDGTEIWDTQAFRLVVTCDPPSQRHPFLPADIRLIYEGGHIYISTRLRQVRLTYAPGDGVVRQFRTRQSGGRIVDQAIEELVAQGRLSRIDPRPPTWSEVASQRLRLLPP